MLCTQISERERERERARQRKEDLLHIHLLEFDTQQKKYIINGCYTSEDRFNHLFYYWKLWRMGRKVQIFCSKSMYLNLSVYLSIATFHTHTTPYNISAHTRTWLPARPPAYELIRAQLHQHTRTHSNLAIHIYIYCYFTNMLGIFLLFSVIIWPVDFNSQVLNAWFIP